jgi:hypothetical protein
MLGIVLALGLEVTQAAPTERPRAQPSSGWQQPPANGARRAKGSDVTRDKLKLLLEEYGRIVLWVYLVIWLIVLAGFALAISAGFNVKSASTSGLGVLGAAWLATKLTQPLRIAGTLALTPVIAAVLKKWRGRSKPQEPNEAP